MEPTTTPSPSAVLGGAILDCSPETEKLFEALALAQGEFKPIEKDGENPHFGKKYATMASIRNSTQEALTKHGLAITQVVVVRDRAWVLETKLVHKGGQFQRSSLPLNTAQAAQQLGSSLTYYRRYLLQAILNVSAEEEDDGNAAQGQGQRRQQSPPRQRQEAPPKQAQGRAPAQGQPPAQPQRQQNPETPISQAQVKRWYAIFKGEFTEQNPHGWNMDQVNEIAERATGQKVAQFTKAMYDAFEKKFQGANYVSASSALGAPAPQERLEAVPSDLSTPPNFESFDQRFDQEEQYAGR